jgi:hypothetical protein
MSLDMNLEVEGELAGFLGVHIVCNRNTGTITMTQIGLTNQIIEAVDALQAYTCFVYSSH